ncbi:hypothetical protein SAMN05216382_1092 [Sphingomonas palmae]|uniref:Anti-bacteriophage protein A/HamA C-terminal domain-containing protein n=1 Tax=Sphingomonas palmae TaxID=1855283 RepID=A0A1H7KWZ8_9SPHN|nr:hypothetical protein [Sphingomonas palmae]SEK91074.1 hypothetical protein SAMN05216382_1092 [Sphingomonas palmae]
MGAIDLLQAVCEPSLVGGPVKRYSNNVVTTDPDDHQWAVVLEACDIDALDDGMLRHAVDAIRAAYGEQEIRDLAQNEPLLNVPNPAEGIGGFETDHLINAFRASLPDPGAEGAKPVHLTNYRSETTEIIAREALSAVFGMATPPALHATKGNRNQPILGFDGWSVMNKSTGELALVLIQVKGTDDDKRPPGEAAKLIVECGKVTTEIEKLKGFLMACVLRCKDTQYRSPLLEMVIELEKTGKVADLVVAPVIIRGLVDADLDDLSTLRAATSGFGHAKARGMTLSLGAELGKFGRTAMDAARQHD